MAKNVVLRNMTEQQIEIMSQRAKEKGMTRTAFFKLWCENEIRVEKDKQKKSSRRLGQM